MGVETGSKRPGADTQEVGPWLFCQILLFLDFVLVFLKSADAVPYLVDGTLHLHLEIP